jgi:K+/H+ antiporter YhaU regulatory subunit KhtT
MSNLHEVKPRVSKITLNDGVERELVFTLNAMAELEERYGEVQKAFDALDAGSFKAIRCVLWAGLLHSDENLTEMQVGKLIDMTTIQTVIDSMTSAMSENLPANDEAVVGIPNA